MNRRKFLISVGGTLLLPFVSIPLMVSAKDIKLVPWKERYAGEDLVPHQLFQYTTSRGGYRNHIDYPVTEVMLPTSMPTEEIFNILEAAAFAEGTHRMCGTEYEADFFRQLRNNK